MPDETAWAQVRKIAALDAHNRRAYLFVAAALEMEMYKTVALTVAQFDSLALEEIMKTILVSDKRTFNHVWPNRRRAECWRIIADDRETQLKMDPKYSHLSELLRLKVNDLYAYKFE